jgi:hypothetical protein
VFELLAHDDEGITVFRNVRNYAPSEIMSYASRRYSQNITYYELPYCRL